MAKLVDALPSGGSVRKDVQVRILFWAPLKKEEFHLLISSFYFTQLTAESLYHFYKVGKSKRVW